MTLINGSPQEEIELSDRGFQYGDGLFETIAVKNGHPCFIDRHLTRLNAGCRRLLIPEVASTLLHSEALSLCKNLNSAVLKIIITRGSGGRGYRQPETIIPTRVLSIHPHPNYPSSYKAQGVTVRFCETRLGLNPALAGIKHLNRLEQVLGRAEWSSLNIQEGIMLDLNGHVIEGTMTNLFYVKNNTLFTSPVLYSGIAGIMREIIMELASSHGYALCIQNFKEHELLSADEAFLCNSIIGIWPIKSINSTRFEIGLITRQLQYMLSKYEHEDINAHL